MKKKITVIAALLVLAIACVTVSADSSTMKVHYRIDPSYMVTIPTDVTIPFNQSDWDYGKIRIEELLLDENQCIQVKLLSDGKLKNQEDQNMVIPYQILTDQKAFISQKYSKAGEETSLTISVLQEDWDQAAGGNYSASVIFDISIVSQNQ